MNPWFSDDHRLRPIWCFLLGVLVAIAANYIAIGISNSIAHGRDGLLEVVYRPLTMLLLLGGFALLLITVDRVHEGVLRALGLGRFPGWRRQALLGIAMGAGLVCLAVIGIALAGNLDLHFKLTGRAITLAVVVSMVLATAAMTEELMFRSYPFQRLLEAVGPAAATVLMSVLFGVAHGSNPHASKLALFNTFLVGVLLCVAYLRTRALWLPWGIHFAWNTTLGVAFGLPVSGLTDFAVMVRARATGPRWVTGGAYGIEASRVGTLVILLGFIPLVLLTRRRGQVETQPAMAEPGGWDGESASDQAAPDRIQM